MGTYFLCALFSLWAFLVSREDVEYGGVSPALLAAPFFVALIPGFCPAQGFFCAALAMGVFTLAQFAAGANRKDENDGPAEMLGGADIACIGVIALYTGFWWAAVSIAACLGCFGAFLLKNSSPVEKMYFTPFLSAAALACAAFRLCGRIPRLGGII